MLSSLLTLSSAISRLNSRPKPSLHYALSSFKAPKSHKQQIRPNWSPRTSSLCSLSAHFSSSENSSSPITQMQTIVSKDDLVVLGIETSCDDTAAAVVRGNGEILSQVVSSQADLLERYGGVAPKMAEEAHLQVIDQKAHKLASSFNLPIISIHHMEAHALVARLIEQELHFPFMALLISGGHNLLILARELGQYIQLGTTIDDAIGEAYDKTAKWLGLDMRRSGGPALEELAQVGDAESIKFSTPMKQHKDCNFSYAGLKTQVRLAIESRNINAEIPISSASCQDRSSELILLHLFRWSLGVASNQYVRTRLDLIVKKNLKLVCPPSSLCTDNGVMVAWTGIEHFCMGRFDPPPLADEAEDFVYDLRPRWPLGEEYAEGRSNARSVRRARIHPSLTSLIQASLQEH
ncbi:hypothetical protein GH714_043787 [Hevea brasiliensis]|uniref:Gcp-like domain-containing protein n=1 Tax=Hevea brasiliensis TaxID=3981 RepID=A0A6A6K223_HEVBR|nr:hypothetical protein GH714_043787 [Hevea brasiliensis]